MQRQVTMGDIFHHILSGADDIRSGRIDPQQGLSMAAQYKNANDHLNNAINMVKMELLAGMPYRSPFDLIASRSPEQRQAIESKPAEDMSKQFDNDSIKSLANIATVDAKKEQKSRLPKIGVCGMSPNQAGAIAADIGEFAELDFWHDDGQGRLQSMASRCDIIFVNRGQVCHKTTEMLDALKANYVMPKTNGKTAMLEAIKGYFAGLGNGN